MNNNDDIENKIYFSKYKPEKKIGEGSFGKIYSAVNIYTNEKFALKLVKFINIKINFLHRKE
jgi:serine/threonine protein kinase